MVRHFQEVLGALSMLTFSLSKKPNPNPTVADNL